MRFTEVTAADYEPAPEVTPAPSVKTVTTGPDGRMTCREVIPAYGVAMTYDVTPAAGETVAELGQGVTVVQRVPPADRDGKPMRWAAPYAVNCTEHGRQESRRTLPESCEAAGAHLAAEHGVPLPLAILRGHVAGHPERWITEVTA